MLMKTLLIISLICFTQQGFYENNSNVVKLTAANFQSEVINSSDLWLVEFYAPWCGHCKHLAPEWEKAATSLKGIAKLGAVNMDEERSVGAPYNIQGFPTIKFFGSNKQNPQEYNGARSASGISSYMITQIQNVVNERSGSSGSSSSSSGSSTGSTGGSCGGGSAGGSTCGGGSAGGSCGGGSAGGSCGGGSSGGSKCGGGSAGGSCGGGSAGGSCGGGSGGSTCGGGSSGGSKCGGGSAGGSGSATGSANGSGSSGGQQCGSCYSGGSASSSGDEKNFTDKDVIVLDDSNFNEKLMQSDDMWIVEFYAPWCGHCKSLEPHWNKFATTMKGKKFRVAKYNADANKQVSGRFKINGFPTIKYFAPGKKADFAEDYQGHRDAEALIKFAYGKMEQYGIEASIDQLISETMLQENCVDKTVACIIAFLPNIYDSSAEQRNGYIKELVEASKIIRGRPISMFWAQGGDFFDYEEKLNLSFGYPAVVALNYAKKKYSIFRSSFSAKNIEYYITNLLTGKELLNDLPKELPILKTRTEWDGKDYVPETEESI